MATSSRGQRIRAMLTGGFHSGMDVRLLADSGYINGRNLEYDARQSIRPRRGLRRWDYDSANARNVDTGARGLWLAEFEGRTYWLCGDGRLRYGEAGTVIDALPIASTLDGSDTSISFGASAVLGLNKARRLYLACGHTADVQVIKGTTTGSIVTTDIEGVSPTMRAFDIDTLTGEESDQPPILSLRAKSIEAHDGRLVLISPVIIYEDSVDYLHFAMSDLTNQNLSQARGYGNQFGEMYINYAPFDEELERAVSIGVNRMLLLSKNRSWLLFGVFGAKFELVPNRVPGITAPRSLQRTSLNYCYYLSARGIVRTTGESYELVKTREMQGWLADLSEHGHAHAVYLEDERQYRLYPATMMSDDGLPDRCWVYDEDEDRLTLETYGRSFVASGVSAGEPMLLDGSGAVYQRSAQFADGQSRFVEIKSEAPQGLEWPIEMDAKKYDGPNFVSPLFVFPLSADGTYKGDGADGAAAFRVFLERGTTGNIWPSKGATVAGATDPKHNDAQLVTDMPADHPFGGTDYTRPIFLQGGNLAGYPMHFGDWGRSKIIQCGAIMTGASQIYYVDISARDLWEVQGNYLLLNLTPTSDRSAIGLPQLHFSGETPKVYIGAIDARLDLCVGGSGQSVKMFRELAIRVGQGDGSLMALAWPSSDWSLTNVSDVPAIVRFDNSGPNTDIAGMAESASPDEITAKLGRIAAPGMRLWLHWVAAKYNPLSVFGCAAIARPTRRFYTGGTVTE